MNFSLPCRVVAFGEDGSLSQNYVTRHVPQPLAFAAGADGKFHPFSRYGLCSRKNRFPVGGVTVMLLMPLLVVTV